ncbi:CLAVATA3/ESR (CLE)-related protein 6, partial [Mucuna pruriens]
MCSSKAKTTLMPNKQLAFESYLCKTMATSTMPRVFILFLIIIPLVVVSSKARPFFPKFSTMMDEKINSELLLRHIVSNVRNREYHHHKRSMLEGRLERLSPAGPDPQHH